MGNWVEVVILSNIIVTNKYTIDCSIREYELVSLNYNSGITKCGQTQILAQWSGHQKLMKIT